METMGDIKRMHMDSRVTVEHHLFDPIPQHGKRVETPEDIETPLQHEFLAPGDINIDPSTHPVIDQPQSEGALTKKLNQLNVDIHSDNEEFIKCHQTWSPSGTPVQDPRTEEIHFDELPLDLAVRHCMYGWPTFNTLFGHPNDPTLRLHGVFAEMPFSHLSPKLVFIRDGNDPVVRALHEVQAEEVPPGTFRMCNGALGLDTPLLGSDYRV